MNQTNRNRTWIEQNSKGLGQNKMAKDLEKNEKKQDLEQNQKQK